MLLVSIAVCALQKNKWVVILLSIILGLFLLLELVSINMGGNLIDYRFYEHIKLKDIWSLKDFFATEILVFTIVYIIICTLLYYTSRWLRSKIFPKWLLPLAILVGVLIMFVPNGPLNNIYGIIDLKTAKTESFNEALKNLGIDPATYITSDEITATPGKNIIVLSLESLERGYLEPPLEKLTPNLREFAKTNTYIKMEESLGSGWTTASMYTTITGLPAYFKDEGNQIFQNTIDSEVSNLGNILNSASYSLTYLIGNKEFSGIQDMLKTFGFTVKSEEDFETKYPKINWGLHDKDLFEEAKKEILVKKTQEQPFAIFMSTISGHYPDGVYDQRMEKVLPKQETKLEFMTSAVDYYIGDLIKFLENEKLMENTVIYIFPDHMLMKKMSNVIRKFPNKRGLYVITNADIDKATKNLYEPITQIDLPRIILNGAGVETNATFLTDYIKDGNKDKFLQKNKKNLLALNVASLKRFNYNEGFKLAISDKGKVEIISLIDGFKTSIPKIEENTLYTIDFQNDMRFVSNIKINHEEKGTFSVDRYTEDELKNAFKGKASPTLTFSVVGDSIYGYLQQGGLFGVARAGEKEISFSKNDLNTFKQWKTTKTGHDLDASKIFLRSTGYTFIKNYGNSRIFTGLKPHLVTRGLNVLYIENSKYKVKNYDTYGSSDDAMAFIQTLKQFVKNGIDFYIIAHDAAAKELENFEDDLSDLGLNILSELEEREAYIGYIKNGKIFEQKNEKSITLEFDIKNLPPDHEIGKNKKDTLRFIAHAGGGINGDTYTNSLEALNYNYKKGFRLFELDIIKTADNVFVSAHDWVHWSKKTNFKGETPPTRKVFLENPIKNYTPLDIDAINLWFKEHTDAILVTDKVNSPKEFASKFIDKDRLMMELLQ